MAEHRPHEPDVARLLPDDDEIDLRDLWATLKRRRLFVLAMTIGAVLVASAVVFVMPPTFESRVVIQVGQVGQVTQAGQPGGSVHLAPLEPPRDLIHRLREEYRVDMDSPPRPYPRVEAVAAVDRSNPSGIIEIRAHGRTPEQAQAFLRNVTDGVLAELGKLFTQFVGLQREERGRLAAAAARLEEDVVRLAREAERRGARSDPLSAMLVLEKGQRLLELNELRSQIAQWDLLLSPANTYETRVIVEPTLRTAPVKPNKVLVIVLAGALGLFLATFVVLVSSAGSRPGGRGA